jgi:hypothetical protein
MALTQFRKLKYEKEISAAFCGFVLSERNLGTRR